jgi:hypothetical protein
MLEFDLKYWRQFQNNDAFEISREELVSYIIEAIDEWNSFAEEGSEVVDEKEKKAILWFGKQYWENNNNIIDEEVIHAFISQYV